MLDRAPELRPDDAAAHSMRGEVLRRCGRYAEALAEYDRSLNLRPDAATHTLRGHVLSELERYAEAVAAYD